MLTTVVFRNWFLGMAGKLLQARIATVRCWCRQNLERTKTLPEMHDRYEFLLDYRSLLFFREEEGMDMHEQSSKQSLYY